MTAIQNFFLFLKNYCDLNFDSVGCKDVKGWVIIELALYVATAKT